MRLLNQLLTDTKLDVFGKQLASRLLGKLFAEGGRTDHSKVGRGPVPKILQYGMQQSKSLQ